MNSEQIKNNVEEVFQEVFNNPALEINDGTSAADIEEWDSLQHIVLMINIEKKFKIKFTAKETQSLNNAGAIMKALQNKLG